MNYIIIYNNLCLRGQSRIFKHNMGLERHHIIPRCMGGSNEKNNITVLTGREHYIVHQLLVKIYPNNYKLVYALNCFNRKGKGQVRTSRQYEWIKKLFSDTHSDQMSNREITWGNKIGEGVKAFWKDKKRPASSASWKKGHVPANTGKKRPGIGGRKKGCIIPDHSTPQSIKKMADTKKAKNQIIPNKLGYEILTDNGFKPFAGVKCTGLVDCLEFITETNKKIIVSRHHKFYSDKEALEYNIGNYLLTSAGLEKIISIIPVGKKQVFDMINVLGHLYDANSIINHNCAEFCVDENSVIIPEWKEQYIQDVIPNELYKFYHRYVGMDLGVKDFTAAVFGYYDFKKACLIIEDELTLNGPTLTTLVLKDEIVKKEKELWDGNAPYLRIADSNNPLLIQDLSNLHELYFRSTNKDSLEAMLNAVRLMVDSGKIMVNPRCKQLIGCLKYAVWDTAKKGLARSSVYGHFDHLMALVYLVRNLDKVTNPIPRFNDVDPSTHFISTEYNKNISGTAAIFENMFSPTLKSKRKY